jgi:hypothetical protein
VIIAHRYTLTERPLFGTSGRWLGPFAMTLCSERWAAADELVVAIQEYGSNCCSAGGCQRTEAYASGSGVG